jgi:hypoxanthine phosphoribosyltransferase
MIAPYTAHEESADLLEVLFTEEDIRKRVEELGAVISRDYSGRDLTVMGVLRGAFIFIADLMRHITVPCAVDFMAVESYHDDTRSSGVVRMTKDLDENVADRHVLVVEDIIDSGRTLNYLLDVLRARHPASLQLCTLLDKPSRREVPIDVKYRGFEVPDEFVVGYGLDYRQRYRGLPCIGILKPEIYGSSKTD